MKSVRRLKNSVFSLALFFGCATNARAQEACGQEADVDTRWVDMSHRGEEGLWAPTSTIDCVVRKIQTCELLRHHERTAYLTQKSVDKKLIESLRVDLAENEASAGRLEASLRAMSARKNAGPSVLLHPVLWGIVGAGLGGTVIYFVAR